MKPTKARITTACIAAAFGALFLLHRSLGLSDAWGALFSVASLACWIAFFIYQRKQKARGLDRQETVPLLPVAQQKKIKLFPLLLMLAVTLSGPWWLPYTGSHLPFRHLVIVGILTSVTCTIAYVIATRAAPKA